MYIYIYIYIRICRLLVPLQIDAQAQIGVPLWSAMQSNARNN